MRVAVVCDFFLKYAEHQMRALRQVGADVALLCRDHAYEFGGDENERAAALSRIAADGVHIIEVPGRVTAAAHAPAILRARRELRRWRADIAHAHDLYDPRLLYVLGGVPLVTTIHDVVRHPGAPRLTRAENAVRRLWFRRTSLFLVHGERLRHELTQQVGDGRVAVLPLGADVAEMFEPPPDDRVVLFFGRLEPYKGLPVLLEAMEVVRQTRPDVELMIAGSGPEARHLVARPGLRVLTGYVPEIEVDALFRQASLVVLPYTEGSLSGVGLLAVARGIPTIVSDVGALPEIALDASHVVPPGDVAALARAILAHVDAGSDIRAAVLEHARRRFAWSEYAVASVALYKQVLDRGPPAEVRAA